VSIVDLECSYLAVVGFVFAFASMAFGEMLSGSPDPVLTHDAGRLLRHFSDELPKWQFRGATFGEGPSISVRLTTSLSWELQHQSPSLVGRGGKRKEKTEAVASVMMRWSREPVESAASTTNPQHDGAGSPLLSLAMGMALLCSSYFLL
jgi:hypothetical protein